IEVARPTSSPMRSSIRRSTPGMGDGVQSSRAAWTAARAPKSELRFMTGLRLFGPCGLRAPESDRASSSFSPTRKLTILNLFDRVYQATRARFDSFDLIGVQP